MSRAISSNLLSALTAPVAQPFYAVELFFNQGTVRLWTGVGDRTINNDVYVGAIGLLGVSAAEEISDLSAKTMSITVSGLESAALSIAMTEPYQRRVAKVYLGEQSVSDVVEIFSGQMNTMSIEDSGENSTIQISIESKLVELERSANWRYTDENHKSRNSGDSFFSYVKSIQDLQVAWGRKAS